MKKLLKTIKRLTIKDYLEISLIISPLLLITLIGIGITSFMCWLGNNSFTLSDEN
jgi:hypothetical protein